MEKCINCGRNIYGDETPLVGFEQGVFLCKECSKEIIPLISVLKNTNDEEEFIDIGRKIISEAKTLYNEKTCIMLHNKIVELKKTKVFFDKDKYAEESKKIVNSFLESKNQYNLSIRNKTLIDLGLYVKKYSPDNTCDNKYPYNEYDEETDSIKYYKIFPCQVTDEEYEQILNYTDNIYEDESKLANVLKSLAVVIWVIGFMSGIISGYEYAWGVAFIAWISTFIFGILIFGLGDIIQLLTNIKNKLCQAKL